MNRWNKIGMVVVTLLVSRTVIAAESYESLVATFASIADYFDKAKNNPGNGFSTQDFKDRAYIFRHFIPYLGNSKKEVSLCTDLTKRFYTSSFFQDQANYFNDLVTVTLDKQKKDDYVKKAQFLQRRADFLRNEWKQ